MSDGVVLLRPPTVEDASAHTEAARESWRDVGPWLSWCHEGYTVDESRAWIEDVIAARERRELFEWFIFDAEDPERFLGGCGLRVIGPKIVNLGYWVRTGAAGRGVMTRAARLAIAHAFGALGCRRVEILMQPGNEASKRVAEKAGGHYEGILRNRIVMPDEHKDALCYSVIPSDLADA